MFKRTEPGSIWLHAVSVGEVVSAIPLIKQLRYERPNTPLYLTASTIAGRRAAERQAAELVDGIFYAPIDFVWVLRRVIRSIRPALLVVLETEIWPNLYAEVKRTGAGLAIANGRISDRTWPRYLGARQFFRPILCLPDIVMVQGKADYERYLQLGVSRESLLLAGNLKYDAALAPAPLDLPTFGAEHIWIAASTVGPNERGSAKRHSIDEDDIVIRAFQKLSSEFPKLLLILAPRQPGRFNVVAGKLRRAGIPFLRRSGLKEDPNAPLRLPGALLLDTIGELSRTYALANVVFVGGSIAPRGGHNILEPAAAGAPIITGSSMHNFAAIVQDFLQASAMVQINSGEELTGAVRSLLLDKARANDLGTRARTLVLQQAGTSQRVAERLWSVFYNSHLQPPRTAPVREALKLLSYSWIAGGRWKRFNNERVTRLQPPLPVPVISVGGITVGGSGKTPFTNYLADRLRQRGQSPAVLTRGYRRRSPARSLVFGPGTKVSSALTGDEAQIFLRAGNASVGIGSNRYETAKILLSQAPETDILLLDDGFQHALMARDVDIVLIDGLDPFGGGDVVPVGRLREPLSALRRADIFVVTRADNAHQFASIQARLRQFNDHAAVFRTRLIARQWLGYLSGAPVEVLRKRRVAAFCGLGNPQNFWNTLEGLGLEVVFFWAFDDHHAYTPLEVQRLAHQARAHGADLLVTTEKDRINLPENLDDALKQMSIAWLEIELELEDETSFFVIVDNMLAVRSREKANLVPGGRSRRHS